MLDYSLSLGLTPPQEHELHFSDLLFILENLVKALNVGIKQYKCCDSHLQ